MEKVISVKVSGKFIEDWGPASEDLYEGAVNGVEEPEFISLIEKIENAPRKKSGKTGFSIQLELSEKEALLLRGEAIYRAEFNSLEYQDSSEDVDAYAHKAAHKIFAQIEEQLPEQGKKWKCKYHKNHS
jgi:hypothetical protein